MAWYVRSVSNNPICSSPATSLRLSLEKNSCRYSPVRNTWLTLLDRDSVTTPLPGTDGRRIHHAQGKMPGVKSAINTTSFHRGTKGMGMPKSCWFLLFQAVSGVILPPETAACLPNSFQHGPIKKYPTGIIEHMR